MMCKRHNEENCAYCESQQGSFLDVPDHEAKLSSRVRANSEAAPWVVDEIKKYEDSIAELVYAREEHSLSLLQHQQRIQELIEKFFRQYEICRVLEDALLETTELLDGVEDDFVELDIRKRKNKRLVEDIHKDRYDYAVNNLMKDL